MPEQKSFTPKQMTREQFGGGIGVSLEFAINILVGVLTHLVPTDGLTQNKYKKAFLKVFKLIATVYGDDPNFKA